MKKLTFIILLMSTQALAVPTKGTITVLLDNGMLREYPADKYLVVKRGRKKKKSNNISVASPLTRVVFINAPTLKKNRVRVMGGYGPNGFNVDGGPKEYSISSSGGALGGVGYSRLLNSTWSVDVQSLTNKTFMVGVGFDF